MRIKMKIFATVLLASFSFAATGFAEADRPEKTTVTGKDLSGIGGGSGFPGGIPGPRPGRAGIEKQRFEGNEGGGQPIVRTPEGKYCPARFVKENKPTPLCGSFGELPTWGRGNFNQTYLKCEGEAEYLWKEVFLGCSDPT
jgi:hypothetical protein